MSALLRIYSSPSFKCPRVYPCQCAGCIHEDTLFLSRLVDSTSLRMDGALVDAWPYFPGLKVGKLFLYSSFFDYLVALFFFKS
jgi:hypothetical protein